MTAIEPLYQVEAFGGGRPAPAHDLATLHAELLPDSPLTLLGREFMSRFYYRELPPEDLIFGFVALVDGRPAGFISLTADSDHFMRVGLRRKWPIFAAAATLALLARPKRIRALLEASSISRDRGRRTEDQGKQFPCGEILSFGVRSSFRGSEFRSRTSLRIADDLFTRALAEFERRRVMRARGIVDQDNVPIQRFHEKYGLRLLPVPPNGWRKPSYEYEWTNPRFASPDVACAMGAPVETVGG